MKSVEVQNYSKHAALETTGFDVEMDRLKNATQAWKKAGSPVNTKALNNFMNSYLKDKKAIGGYIVIEPAADDTRLRPYSVINETTKGKRKAKTTYQIKEAELKLRTKKIIDSETGEESEVTEAEVLSTGIVANRAAKKQEAFKLMKELISENRKNYVVEIVKEITEGQKYAGYGVYTPSKSAKMGKFVFFIAE